MKPLTSVLKDGPSDGHKGPSNQSTPVCASKSGSTWETLVLFAVNLSKLNIHMNMGNVMGNTMLVHGYHYFSIAEDGSMLSERLQQRFLDG